ncbi:MAG: sugar kinase [Deltaproteobacteria bacterium GWA2_50_8]|nr:MAG: sugar kinase [Deltaproteobacteria bacterium GWA2_50_8]
MSILVVGTVALDSVETPFGKEDEILGGSATHFSMAARILADVHLVAVVGEDFPQSHLDLFRKKNIDTKGLQVQRGKTFRWKGRYGFDLNVAETLETHLNVLEDFVPQIPDSFKNIPYVFLGNIHPVLQGRVLDQVKNPKIVALDTMNFWIKGAREDLKKTLSRVDIVIVNDAEVRQLSQESNLVKAAKKICSWGPKVLVIKQGEYGALLYQGERFFSSPGLPLEEVYDPTGAGDSFAGGFMGYLSHCGGGLEEGTLKQAVIVGSTMASFNVQEFSCNRLKRLTKEEIQARLKVFKTLSHFDDVKLR